MTSERCEGEAPASSRGGAFVSVLVFFSVIFALAALAWMLFLPMIFAEQLQRRTGFDVTLRSLAVNPCAGTIELRGLVLTNPPGFPVRDFLQLREFRAEAQVMTLLSDRAVFDNVVLDVAQITVVKTTAGRTNAELFEQGFAERESAAGASRVAQTAPRFLIQRLTLRFDRLVVADHSETVPQVREIRLNLNRSFTGVTDLKPLLSPEVWQSLAPIAAAVSSLVPNDLGRALQVAAHDSARTGAERLKRAGEKAGEKVKGYLEALEESKKP